MENSNSNKKIKIIKLRKIKLNDYQAIINLQIKCSKNLPVWSYAEFKNIITAFPQGQICIVCEKKIIASSFSVIINYTRYNEILSFKECIAKRDGNSFVFNGDTLYCTEVMVDPNCGIELSRRLYDEQKKTVKLYNLKRILVNAIFSNYSKYQAQMSVKDYITGVIETRIKDPSITAQFAYGFRLKQVPAGYLDSEKISGDYSTILEWTNFNHKVSKANDRKSNLHLPTKLNLLVNG